STTASSRGRGRRSLSSEPDGDPLEAPEGGEDSHRVDRETRGAGRARRQPSPDERAGGEHGADERELTHLDAAVERHERERDVAGGQPRLGERTREAE